MKKLLSFILLLASFEVLATKYRPLTFDQLIDESNGATRGIVTELKAVMKDGQIWTKVTITNKVSYNINSPQIEMYIPGGTINGKSMKIESVDFPNIGDEKFYFVKYRDGFYYISNLSLGEFSIRKVGNEEILISKIFPDFPGLKNLSTGMADKKMGAKGWLPSLYELPAKVETIHEKVVDATTLKANQRDIAEQKVIAFKEDNAPSGMIRIVPWLTFAVILGCLIYGAMSSSKKKNEKR